MVSLKRRSAKEAGESDEYGTPIALYEYLNKEFKFQLDVCASRKNHKHKNYLTKKDDALHPLTPWSKRNFCNPPYSNIIPWYLRAIEEAKKRKAITVFLSKWDHSTIHGDLVMRYFTEVYLIKHRIKFVGAKHSANFPSFIGVVRPTAKMAFSLPEIGYVDYRILMEGV